MDLKVQVTEALYKINGYQKELYEVEQNLGVALGYPRYADDKKNFPAATENDGVCTGEHTPATLAMEAAQKIVALQAEVKEIQENSVHKSVFDNLAAELIKAQQAQISFYDLEYPPHAMQGGPVNGELLDLLTADDVNRLIFQVRELTEQINALKIQLHQSNMDRSGAYAKIDAIEQASLENSREYLEDRKVLEQHISARERIAYRALRMVINSRNNPLTSRDATRAEVILATMSVAASQTETERETYLQDLSQAQYQGRMNYDIAVRGRAIPGRAVPPPPER